MLRPDPQPAPAARSRDRVRLQHPCRQLSYPGRGAGLFADLLDPEPRTEIESLPGVRFLREYIQNVPPSTLFADLEPSDIVFYDGSHTVKTGSDTVYFYL